MGPERPSGCLYSGPPHPSSYLSSSSPQPGQLFSGLGGRSKGYYSPPASASPVLYLTRNVCSPITVDIWETKARKTSGRRRPGSQWCGHILVVLVTWGCGWLLEGGSRDARHPAVQRMVPTQGDGLFSMSIASPSWDHRTRRHLLPTLQCPSPVLVRGKTKRKDECQLLLKHACFQITSEGIQYG